MPKARAKFEYDYEAIVKLSDWPYNRLVRDVTDERVNAGDLASVLCWLARNGKPWLRARLASALLPDLLGSTGRSAEVNEMIDTQSAPELLTLVFQQLSKPRKQLAKKRGKRG